MEDLILQILLLQAYLAICLVSVTFPVYAICVGYLRKETIQFEHEQKKRLKLVRDRISKLTKKRELLPKDELNQIDVEIQNTKNELRTLEAQYKPLTAKGAVRNPILYLFASLLFSIGAIILTEPYVIEAIIILALISCIFIYLATNEIYVSIKRTEQAALRREFVAGFEVNFENDTKNREIRLKKETNVKVFLSACEDVENLDFRLYIPPGIELREHNLEHTYGKLEKEFDYPDHFLVIETREFFQKGRLIGYSLKLFSDKEGQYKIPVEIFGKDFKRYSCELILNVKK